jgi:hypothetical protein
MLTNNISFKILRCYLLLANTHNISRPCIENVIEEILNVTFKMENIDKVVFGFVLI